MRWDGNPCTHHTHTTFFFPVEAVHVSVEKNCSYKYSWSEERKL